MKLFKLYRAFTFISLLALILATGCIVIPIESAEEIRAPVQNKIEAANAPPAPSAPVITSFKVMPEVASPGIPVTLSWNVSDATYVSIQPELGEVALNGSKQLSPGKTTTYFLTASNSAGSKTALATVTVPPGEQTHLIGVDPVSGRNDQIDLRWEQLCLASEYQVQIAKDPDFSIIVLDTGPFAPADATSPAAYYPAGGRVNGIASGSSTPLDPGTSALALPSMLEAGHTYFVRVRVRQTATGLHMLSPWSEIYKLTVKSGLPITSPSYSPQPLSPNNGCLGCATSPVAFSWTPYKDTTKYKFVLAKDAAMTMALVDVVVPTTAYKHDGTLDYSTNYFWRVMAMEPAPSDWSPTFTFQTEPAPPAPPAPVQAPSTPLWAWALIGLGAILAMAVIALIIMARQKRNRTH